MVADLAPCAGFDDATVLHDGYSMTEVADQRHRVGNEEIGEAIAELEVAQKIDDLRTDGDIERAHRLVEDEKFGTERNCARYVDALTLAAGELMGITTESRGIEVDLSEELVEAMFETLGRLFPVDSEGLG